MSPRPHWHTEAPSPGRRTLACAALCGALALLLVVPAASSAQAAGFGFLPGTEGFNFAATNQDGSPATEAGTHPYDLISTVNFNQGPESPAQPGVPFPAADVKDMRFELPSGLIGNPSVLGRCTLAQFNTPRSSPFEPSASGESCPDKSQIGTVAFRTSLLGGSTRTFGLFSLTPPPGVAAELGVAPFGDPIAFGAQVRNVAGEYGLDMEARNFPQGLAIDGVKITVWGTPWVASHDTERGNCLNEVDPASPWAKCSVGTPKNNRPQSFLTLPNSCTGPLSYSASVDSWQYPGAFVSDRSLSRDAEGNPQGLQRCDQIHFQTSSFSQPTTARASTATGFEFDLKVDQEGLLEPEGHSGSQVRKAVVALPEGFTINPSVGAGLGVCTPGQYAFETATSTPGAGCPSESKIGSFSVQSPLLIEETNSFEQVIGGSIYLAEPDPAPQATSPGAENPFNTLLAFYLIAKAPGNGILVKAAGELIPNPLTGQLVAVFEGMPQLPYTNLKVHFREGQRAPLATPAACGTYTTDVELTPWEASAQIQPTIDYQNFEFPISQGAGGGPCPGSGSPPFNPGAQDGSENSNAGSYSPYYLHLTRTDTEQEITSYSAVLPPGLTAKIAGVPPCPDADIEAAKAKTGIEEREHPSCPARSEIGHTVTGYGLGGVLDYAPGRLYLAGPYHGAPLSIVAIDSALVGPFDLGVIVIRSAIDVNPETAQVSLNSAGSDPIPHIRDGIPLHLRDIRVYISRKDFTLNPTSCEPFQASSTMNGSSPPFTNPDDIAATATGLYQASNCSSLPFAPKLSLKLAGATHRGAYPSLHAVVTERPGDANIGKAIVALPHAEFLAQSHIREVCTPKQFESDACPPSSVYGYAKAYTPLLSEPLEGPVYLRVTPPTLCPTWSPRFTATAASASTSLRGSTRSTAVCAAASKCSPTPRPPNSNLPSSAAPRASSSTPTTSAPPPPSRPPASPARTTSARPSSYRSATNAASTAGAIPSAAERAREGIADDTPPFTTAPLPPLAGACPPCPPRTRARLRQPPLPGSDQRRLRRRLRRRLPLWRPLRLRLPP